MTRLEEMKFVKEGKTKDVYRSPDGLIVLVFKDDATGKDGVFDPGENQVGLKIAGMGSASLSLTKYFYEKIEAIGIPTHMVSVDEAENIMVVKPAELFSHGLECVCRRIATGSFIRRYGLYVEEGQPLDNLVEITVKDDDRGDPLITEDSLVALGILKEGEYHVLKQLTKDITIMIAELLCKKDMELYDIKVEFGKHKGEIILIDEISAGSMRCYKDGVKLEPLEITRLILSD